MKAGRSCTTSRRCSSSCGRTVRPAEVSSRSPTQPAHAQPVAAGRARAGSLQPSASLVKRQPRVRVCAVSGRVDAGAGRQRAGDVDQRGEAAIEQQRVGRGRAAGGEVERVHGQLVRPGVHQGQHRQRPDGRAATCCRPTSAGRSEAKNSPSRSRASCSAATMRAGGLAPVGGDEPRVGGVRSAGSPAPSRAADASRPCSGWLSGHAPRWMQVSAPVQPDSRDGRVRSVAGCVTSARNASQAARTASPRASGSSSDRPRGRRLASAQPSLNLSICAPGEVHVVDVGDQAPDFELADQDRKPVRLSSFRGARRS